MSFIQPKPYMDRLRLRNHARGVERRRNMSKIILEKNTPFPKPVEYEDIDSAFFDWVDKKLEVVYNGKRLPTYKLFSNQKLSEYTQTWKNLDETGNIVMNFKTITRENNPQHGESQGGNYNVPGNRDYPMFYVPVLQENGEEAYDLYSMKQPLSVNFLYTVTIICNKYELLNKFNELMHYEFSALECYISPNDHPMPMVIENITDESEYSIDDRKFYAQAYQIKLMAYVIRKEDFKVTKIPSRFIVRILTDESKRKYKKVSKDEFWLGPLENSVQVNKEPEEGKVLYNELPKLETIKDFDVCETVPKPNDILHEPKPVVYVEEIPDCCYKEESPYINKVVKLIIDFPYCGQDSVNFVIDTTIDIDAIETKNVHDFVIKVNGEVQTFEDEVKFFEGDKIEVSISREDEYGDSNLTIVGNDPETVIDTRIDAESELDSQTEEEDIYVKLKGAE